MIEVHELKHADGRRLYIYGRLYGELPAESADRALPDLEQRLDILTGARVAISPARNTRPDDQAGPAGCPFCPGGREVPFPYQAAVFENAWPALMPPSGECEVVLYTSVHDRSFATLTDQELAMLLEVWRHRSRALWADERHVFVMIFENRGALAGATIPHPHGQIYAFDHLPPFIAARVAQAISYRQTLGACASCDAVADAERSERVLCDGEAFVTAVPFAPQWPYEVHVRARTHDIRRIGDLSEQALSELGIHLRDIAGRLDRLFGYEMPYMMVALEAPDSVDDWHLAFEFLPLGRNETQMKIRASVETATGLFIVDAKPEEAAARLRAVADRMD